MYGENTNTIAIPIYRVLPYPVMFSDVHCVHSHDMIHVCTGTCIDTHVYENCYCLLFYIEQTRARLLYIMPYVLM